MGAWVPRGLVTGGRAPPQARRQPLFRTVPAAGEGEAGHTSVVTDEHAYRMSQAFQRGALIHLAATRRRPR